MDTICWLVPSWTFDHLKPLAARYRLESDCKIIGVAIIVGCGGKMISLDSALQKKLQPCLTILAGIIVCSVKMGSAASESRYVPYVMGRIEWKLRKQLGDAWLIFLLFDGLPEIQRPADMDKYTAVLEDLGQAGEICFILLRQHLPARNQREVAASQQRFPDREQCLSAFSFCCVPFWVDIP